MMSHTEVRSDIETPQKKEETVDAQHLEEVGIKPKLEQHDAKQIDCTQTDTEKNMFSQRKSKEEVLNDISTTACTSNCSSCQSIRETILETKPNAQDKIRKNCSSRDALEQTREQGKLSIRVITEAGKSLKYDTQRGEEKEEINIRVEKSHKNDIHNSGCFAPTNIPKSDTKHILDVGANDDTDGLLKKIFRSKSKPSDEDAQLYGFEKYSMNDDENGNEKRGIKSPTFTRSTSCGNTLGPMDISPSIDQQHSYRSEQNVSSRRRYHENVNMDSQSHIDSDCYYFSHLERGYMLIIINEFFDIQDTRDGARCDLRNMRAIARKFGFRILNHKNDKDLTKQETMYWLNRAQETDHSKCDCFAFVISTHGYEKKNADAGGREDHALVCADEETIFTSTITDKFNDDNCPTLMNKPKFFFIQACRGEHLDHGADVRVLQTVGVDKTCSVAIGKTRAGRRRPMSFDVCDTKPHQDTWTSNQDQRGQSFRTQKTATVTINQEWTYGEPGPTHYKEHNLYHSAATERNPYFRESKFSLSVSSHTPQSSNTINERKAMPHVGIDIPSIKCDNDMLVLYAIQPGYFAWRNSMDGSWMISYLHQILMAYDFDEPKNFLSVLTKVNAQMSQKMSNAPQTPERHGKKAVSVIEHKLTRDVFFRQKIRMSDWKSDLFN